MECWKHGIIGKKGRTGSRVIKAHTLADEKIDDAVVQVFLNLPCLPSFHYSSIPRCHIIYNF
jgi:hypothetical protein